MSQDLVPVNGGRETIIVNNIGSTGIFLSEQYTIANKILPQPTEWIKGGRPIYDRLPAASERYKVDFSYEKGNAYTYIPSGEGYTGTTSMSVNVSEDKKYLIINGGYIVWEFGTIEADPVIIDIEAVEMGSANYLIAYQMYYDDSPQEYQFEVSDFNLSGYKMNILSSTDGIRGWRYTPQYAFINDNTRYWSNYDSLYGIEPPEPFIAWQLPLPCSLSKIVLRCPANTSYTGTASLYYVSCQNSTTDFCEYSELSGNWGETVEVSRDDDGQYYEFTIDSPISARGWAVIWSDPHISISNITVSGVVTLSKKPASMTTNYALVAYPKNSTPSSFTNSLGEEVPVVLCKLAYVDIDSNFQATALQDIREVVTSSYEPVAEWLTRPWDNNLISLFNNLSNYNTNWMSPVSCMNQEYDNLRNYDINLQSSVCEGLKVSFISGEDD